MRKKQNRDTQGKIVKLDTKALGQVRGGFDGVDGEAKDKAHK
jgi:hypothetical protein